MGVKGLWTLLEPVGKPVTLESLEGKVLAVDVSIWLHQTVHGMRDKHGDPVANAHLVGLFNRVCKLLFYKIKPIFVFDGGVPELKKQTLIARRQQRTEATERSEQATRKYLSGLLKQHAIGSVLSGKGSQPMPSASRARGAEKPDMYELPPLPQNESFDPFEDEVERTLDMRATFLDMISEEFQDPEDIDPDSPDFQALPAELQYELLKELKEHRKQRRWQNTVEMPENTEEFSNFQIKRMMNRSRLSQRLDGVRKEINSSASGDMVLSLTGRGPGEGVESQRLVSDESSHYILVKGLKKNSEKEKILADLRKEDMKEEKHMEYKDIAGDDIQETIDITLPKSCDVKDIPVDHKEDYGETEKTSSPQNNVQNDSSDDEMLQLGKFLSSEMYASTKVTNHEQTEGIFLVQNTGASTSSASTTAASTSGIGRKSSLAKPKTDQGQDGRKIHFRTSSPEVLMIDDDSDGNQSDCIYIEDECSAKSVGKSCKKEEEQIVPLCTEDAAASVSNKGPVIDITGEGGFIRDDSSDDDNDITIQGGSQDGSDRHSDVAEQPNKPQSDEQVDSETDNESHHSESPPKVLPEKATGAGNAAARKEPSAFLSSDGEEDTVRSQPVAVRSQPSQSSTSRSQASQSSAVLSQPSQPTAVRSQPSQSSAVLSQPSQPAAVQSQPSQPLAVRSQQSQSSATRSQPSQPSQSSTFQSHPVTAPSVGTTLAASHSEKSPSVARQVSTATVHSIDSASDDDFEEVPVADRMALDISYSPLKRQRAVEESTPSMTHTDSDMPICIDEEEMDSDTAEPPVEINNAVPTKPAARPSAQQQAALEEMQSQLEAESQTLQEERGRLDRQAATITDQMTIEAQELLRLFGVPYIVSPMEAEAQCAQLDLTDMTEGTVTDDSDIWLFGGRRVFKNMFNHGKYVEYYNNTSIESQLMLDRDKLINIAFLTGSDYTPGVERVGPVTAMEVLAEFPGSGLQPLRALKSWWDTTQARRPIPGTETPVKRKLRNIRLPSGFPSAAVLRAYMKPEVDDSEERFSWSTPDLDLLRTFASQKLGWPQTKSDELLLPVMKRHAETSMQRHITSYFGMQLGEAKGVTSKRVKNVVNRLQDRTRSPASVSPTGSPSKSSSSPSKSSAASTKAASSPAKTPAGRKEPAAAAARKEPSSPVGKPAGVSKRGRGGAKTQATKRPGAATTGGGAVKQSRRGRGGRGRGRAVHTTPTATTTGGRQTVQEVKLSESSSDDD